MAKGPSAQAHDHAPDCPECETDLYVGRREGNTKGWKCWRCGGWWHDDDADEDAGRLVADGCGFVLVVNGSARSQPIYHRPDPGAPDRPRCRVGTDRHEAARYQRRDPDALDERYRLCRHCDPEFTPGVSDPDLSIQDALASADDLDDLRADGGTVTVENPELFDTTVRKLRGFADDLERVDGLNVSASVLRDWARDLEAATRREVDDGE